VYPDASLRVTERITVRAEGRAIRRGIYRDFPTEMTDRRGDRHRVTFEVLDVLRDGQPEAWHTQAIDGGTRVYIGRKDRPVAHGEHSYTLVYRSDRQLRYFDTHDELYWNVTGNDWAFPIDRAAAEVRLPDDIPDHALQVDAYSGARGARGRDWQSWIDGDGDVRFETTASLPVGHGLTIAVGWPKGHVHEPSTGERLGHLLLDNLGLLAGGLGGLVVLAWYLFAWRAVGRDPGKSVIYPRYEPPGNYSPASLRFVRRMDYDPKAFTTALVNLAVKGHVTIAQEGRKYTVSRTDVQGEPLAPGEGILLKGLLGGHRSIDLERGHRTRIRAALKAHEASLRGDYEKRYFVTNRVWLWPGWLLSLFTFVVAFLLAPGEEALFIGLFMSVWLTGWSAGTYGLLANVVGLARRADDLLDYLLVLPVLLFSLPFVAGWLFGVFMLAQATSYSYVALIVAIVALNLVFHRLMKAPTRAGRKLLDETEGFRLYLEVAEGDELALRNPPDKTPELFERYLPYAIALDVEDRWAERFASVLAAATAADGGRYRPRWYHGSRFSAGDPGRFVNGLGSSLGSAVASSSSSSSGVGGGGSSGGGGGGGGGGGW
ncbi:MAG: DUF2207 domain-containing protein, partial [Gammaproteobacteria bacterium]|nr:DUF2207 domain-containing protein [Gammaproteobacteria bacterium]